MNIGIIGGADGPTSIFIASDLSWLAIAAAAIICITAALMIRRAKKRKR